jgi:hypothetical protein
MGGREDEEGGREGGGGGGDVMWCGVHSLPLRIENIVHCDEVLRLVLDARPHASQLLHVTPNPEKHAEVHAHGPHVRASLAAHPKDGEMALVVKLNELGLVSAASERNNKSNSV